MKNLSIKSIIVTLVLTLTNVAFAGSEKGSSVNRAKSHHKDALKVATETVVKIYQDKGEKVNVNDSNFILKVKEISSTIDYMMIKSWYDKKASKDKLAPFMKTIVNEEELRRINGHKINLDGVEMRMGGMSYLELDKRDSFAGRKYREMANDCVKGANIYKRYEFNALELLSWFLDGSLSKTVDHDGKMISENEYIGIVASEILKR